MHRTKIISLLKDYQCSDPGQIRARDDILRFVDSNPHCFERSHSEGHLTASCWLLNTRGDQALMTHHKKLGMWLQLGGHADGDPDLLAVALKEAEEESGLKKFTPLLDGKIFDLDIHLIPGRPNEPEHYHFDVRFLLQAMGSDAFTISDESHNLGWFSADDFPNLIQTDTSVLRMVNKWKSLKIMAH